MSEKEHQKQASGGEPVGPKTAEIKVGESGVEFANLGEIIQYAGMMIRANMVPLVYWRYDKRRNECLASRDEVRDKVALAIDFGIPLGLTKLQAIRFITIINGAPSIWGDALPALVHRAGVAEYIKERYDFPPDGTPLKQWEPHHGVTIESKRKDQTEPVVRSFTVGMAQTMGLWLSNPVWQKHGPRMLLMRARGYNYRDNFADALAGFAIAEEQMDIAREEPTRPAFDPMQARGGDSADSDPMLQEAPEAGDPTQQTQDPERQEAEAAQEKEATNAIAVEAASHLQQSQAPAESEDPGADEGEQQNIPF